MSLLDRTRAVLPSWLAIFYEDPIEIERGEGRHVWDTQGHAYLDFFGGVLTTMTAHALPEVTKAVSEQAGRIIHSSTLYLNRPMVELAEQIAAVSGIPDAKVFLTTSGTEANPKAIMHTEQTAGFSVRIAFDDLGLGSHDVVWMPSPVGHSTGFNYGVRFALHHGLKLVLQDRWDGDEAAGRQAETLDHRLRVALRVRDPRIGVRRKVGIVGKDMLA